MTGKVFYKRRDAKGNVLSLEQLSEQNLHPFDGGYVQVIAGIPWVRLTADDLAFEVGHAILISGEQHDLHHGWLQQQIRCGS